MMKSLLAANRSEKDSFRIPHSVQQSIPIRRIYTDGIWQVGQALAKYRDNSTVSAAVDAGLDWLVWQQEPDGTFVSWGTVSSESVCQVLVALTELGISLEDERFYKNHATLEDVLLRFHQENGSFSHTLDGGSDLTATTQALYALAAAQRQRDVKTTLYDMTDTAQ